MKAQEEDKANYGPANSACCLNHDRSPRRLHDCRSDHGTPLTAEGRAVGTRRWRLRPAPCPYVTHGDVAAEDFVLFECNRRASDPHPPMVWLSVIFAVIDTVLRVPSNFRATHCEWLATLTRRSECHNRRNTNHKGYWACERDRRNRQLPAPKPQSKYSCRNTRYA